MPRPPRAALTHDIKNARRAGDTFVKQEKQRLSKALKQIRDMHAITNLEMADILGTSNWGVHLLYTGRASLTRLYWSVATLRGYLSND